MRKSAERVKKRKHVVKAMNAAKDINRDLKTGSRGRPNMLGGRIILLVPQRPRGTCANWEVVMICDQAVVAACANKSKDEKEKWTREIFRCYFQECSVL